MGSLTKMSKVRMCLATILARRPCLLHVKGAAGLHSGSGENRPDLHQFLLMASLQAGCRTPKARRKVRTPLAEAVLTSSCEGVSPISRVS